MKLWIFSLLLSLTISAASVSHAQVPRLERGSVALLTVLDAIYDASFDFDGVYTITHNIHFLTEKRDCDLVPAEVLYDHFKAIFDEFISYYPDEDLPYEQALIDLSVLAQDGEFKRCKESLENARYSVEVTHYQSTLNDLWIRVEYSVQH